MMDLIHAQAAQAAVGLEWSNGIEWSNAVGVMAAVRASFCFKKHINGILY